MRFIDLRSDTVTAPTKEMRDAMYNALVGDDVYGDDPTVYELEYIAAQRLGKEAAIFVPSGTFGNQLALLTHCKRGDEVILGDDCHITQHEVGASSVIAGVQLRTLISNKGVLNPKDIKGKIRTEDIHFPETGLICLENAHSNGRVIPLQNMEEIYAIAKEHNIPVHVDGARIFNAASYLKVDVKEITKYCDTVNVCLSKGLCAPVGSVLAGSTAFIEKARKGRKLMGGGMRQVGVIAAPGIIALTKMTERLETDHKNAVLMGKLLSEIPGIKIDLEDIHINMVFFDMTDTNFDSNELVSEFYKRGIKINPVEDGLMRFVTNYYVNEEDVYYVIDNFKDLLKV